MSDDAKPNREEQAVDALITGTLHVWSAAEPTPAEIEEFLAGGVTLSESERAALNRMREQLARGQAAPSRAESVGNPEMESLYMAMNRENSKDQLPPAAREEIEKKRAKLLEQLKAKKKPAR